MTLDEIERMWGNASEGDEMDKADWGIDFAEFLIRAVRQLGAIVSTRESASVSANRIEIEDGSLDSDVLALLEEA